MSKENNKLSKKAIAAIIAVALALGTIGACRDSMKERNAESETTNTTTEFSFSTTKPTTEVPTTVTTTEAIIEFTTKKEVEAEPEAVATESEYDYVVNTNTGKFHYSYCSQADRIKSENKAIIHGTSDELQGMGYSPCGKCNP